MKKTPLSRDIAVNLGRAVHYELNGDSGPELRHLLFAARDLIETLQQAHSADRLSRPPTEWLDFHAVKRYMGVLQRTTKRISDLIEHGA